MGGRRIIETLIPRVQKKLHIGVEKEGRGSKVRAVITLLVKPKLPKIEFEFPKFDRNFVKSNKLCGFFRATTYKYGSIYTILLPRVCLKFVIIAESLSSKINITI